MSPPEPSAVVQRVYAAFGAGDVAGLLSLASPTSTWTVHGPPAHPYAGIFRGHEGLGRWLGLIGANVEVLAFEPHTIRVSGDDVFVVGREKGRWKPGGGEYDLTWLQRFVVRAGAVQAFEEWLDTATALAARRA